MSLNNDYSFIFSFKQKWGNYKCPKNTLNTSIKSNEMKNA